MPFYRTEDGGGTFHLNTGRRRRAIAPPCRAPRLPGDAPDIGSICGRLSVALCDAPAGQDLDGKLLTCDMPICQHHRTKGGPDLDYCPRHEHLAPAPLPLETR